MKCFHFVLYYAVEHISLILAAPNWRAPVRFRTDIKVLPGLGLGS